MSRLYEHPQRLTLRIAAAFVAALLVGCGTRPDPPDHPVVDASGNDAIPTDDAGGLDSDGSTDCASSGALDQTFGTGGFVLPLFGPGLAGAGSVVIEPTTSRILVAGGAPWETESAFTIMRLLSDGSLDPSFGAGGISQTCIHDHVCWLERIMLQGDGKIVGVGGINGSERARVALVRYEPDGTLDPTFGNGGIVIDEPAPLASARAGAIDPLGRIVVTAESWDGIAPTDAAYFTTLRYLPSGQRDPSFGVGGIAVPAFTNGQHIARDLALQADGRILVVGASRPFAGGGNFGLVRYMPDGSRDPSFGSMGLLTIPFETGSLATAVALDSSGHAVVVGPTTTGGIMTRRRVDGSPDPSFGIAGAAFANPAHRQIAILPTGQLLLVGAVKTAFHQSSVTLARYDAAGSPDPSFGSGGLVMSSTISPCNLGDHLAVQPDGKVVVVGARGDCIGQLHFLIARYCP